MANKFVIKKGFKSKGDSQITGSLNISNTITALVISGSTISGSLIGDGSNITGAGGGETNTASNTGSGDGLFVEKVSSDLRFKTLLSGGSELTITTSSYEVTVNRQSIVLNETNLYFNNDTTDTTITIGTNSGSNFKALYPVNTLEAIADGSSNVRVQLKGGTIVVATSLVTSSTYINDSLVTTSSQATVINELNALFVNAIGQVAPTITSNTSISLVAGSSVNYTLTGTDIVAYRWYNLPTGLVPKTGNTKTLLGGSSLAVGSYGFTASAANYYGETTANITLTVDPDFTNTYSFSGTGNAWLRNIASYDTSVFYRLSNGSGISEAWSNSFWLKTNFTGTANQSYGIILYGNSGNAVKSIFTLMHDTTNAGTDSNFYFKFGVGDCYTIGLTDIGIANNTWFHVMWTYSGGATVDTGDGFFKFYINGVLKTTTWSFVGPGAYYPTLLFHINRSGGLDLSLFAGTKTYNYQRKYAPNSVMEEFATWKAVELPEASASVLYNSGAPFDISESFPHPLYSYFRMGDNGDVAAHPLMVNNSTGVAGTTSSINLTMYGGSAANYVSDVPS